MFVKKVSVSLLVIMLGVFTACNQEERIELEEYPIQQNVEIEENVDDISDNVEEVMNTEAVLSEPFKTEEIASDESSEDAIVSDEKATEMKSMFGEHCIAEQTFEVKLSEYDGKVYVVPYAPSAEEPEFYIDIIQNGNVLGSLWEYMPEELFGETFTSLDAIAFFDADFDDCTDIVLILTYGDTSFAAVYSGFAKDADEYDRHFYADSNFSENITEQVNTLTIPAIREIVTKGKKNGEFASYQEAYRLRSHLCELEAAGDMEYDLIYFDEDDVPELVVSTGYFVSMYTYSNGSLYTLMDHWAYGAMGNAGYEYSPKKNSLRNYNTDFAGLLLYTTYMGIGEQHELDTIVTIETYNFDDANGNGMPDEEEEGSIGKYGISYIDGVEVTNEDCAVYDMGEYEYIFGSMSYEEFLQTLDSM